MSVDLLGIPTSSESNVNTIPVCSKLFRAEIQVF